VAVAVVCGKGLVFHAYVSVCVQLLVGVTVALPLDCPQFSSVDVAVAVTVTTSTVAEVVAEQPLASEISMLYVVVAVGLAITLAPVVEDNPAAGDHVKLDPPVAVSVTVFPEQIVGFEGVTETAILLTFTVTVVEPEHVPEFPTTV
jgi:branched-subunit amino acid ABC-type transport system permease component